MRADNLVSWIRHLRSVRGFQASTKQMLRMYRYHRTPFNDILENIFGVLNKYDASFTFTIVASIATEDLLLKIRENGHEIASHSLYHVKHRGLPFETQLSYIRRSIDLLQKRGVMIRGFRAPYNSYDMNTFNCLDELGLSYDAGVRQEEHLRKLVKPFYMKIDHKESRFLSFPVFHTSDELLDQYPQKTVLKSFIKHIDTIHDDGLSVLQLHPIRIGQPKYLGFFKDLVEHIERGGYSMPTLIEVIDQKVKTPAVCLSGDIDCLSFMDYLKRI